MKTILLIIAISLLSLVGIAQTDSSKFSINLTTDLVSNYVWRGTASNEAFMNPHFQPTLAWDYKNLEIGVWGSSDFIGKYKEVDTYIAYTLGSVKLTVSDYNWLFTQSYFNYSNESTDHVIEASVGYANEEKCPFSISANVMLFGADKKWDETVFAGYDNSTGDSIYGAQDITKNNYSTYIEMGYAFKKCNVFMGLTPTDGYYGDYYGGKGGFNVVNLGVSTTKDVKINDDYSISYKSSFIVNPQAETIFLVFGITF